MRVNVYAEELTNEVQVIEKEVKSKRYIGARFILKAPPGLYDSDTNDDRGSAVTIWFPDKDTADRILTYMLHALKQS